MLRTKPKALKRHAEHHWLLSGEMGSVGLMVTVRRTRVRPAAAEFKTDGYLASGCRCALQAGGATAPAALARASRQPRGVRSQMSFCGCRLIRGTMSHRYS